jgi:DnaD/phage-associated family protein
MKYNFLFEKSAFCLPGNAVDVAKKASQNDLRVLMALGSGRFTDETQIAKFVGISVSAAVRSLEFWRGAGVVELPEENGEVQVFETCEFTVPTEVIKTVAEEKAPSVEVKKFSSPSVERDSYTSEEIDRICTEKDNVPLLIDACQAILEKTFTKTEISSLVFLSDHLRLDDEYIMMLCTYCKAKDKASVRYVEKVALSLWDSGVVSVPELDKYIKKESKKTETETKIRKLFGLGERTLVPKEREYINKWVIEWALPFELIEKAYEAMMSSGKLDKPSFAYENGILEKWREAGVKTPEDVDALKENRKRSAKSASGGKETCFDLDEFFELAVKRGAGRADGIKTGE